VIAKGGSETRPYNGMKIRILWLGKTRHALFAGLCQEYLERVRRLNPCELVVLRESSDPGRSSLARDEEKALLGAMNESACAVLLDVAGREFDSAGFRAEIARRRESGVRQVDFFLAGPWGWSEAVRTAAHERWTLSRLTLPHELARVVFLEQLYRALARIQGIPYEK
jgi:23S rRNA (pseudouridine1915-N3)-methyltransferase